MCDKKSELGRKLTWQRFRRGWSGDSHLTWYLVYDKKSELGRKITWQRFGRGWNGGSHLTWCVECDERGKFEQ